jgi:hypothetical protein
MFWRVFGGAPNRLGLGRRQCGDERRRGAAAEPFDLRDARAMRHRFGRLFGLKFDRRGALVGARDAPDMAEDFQQEATDGVGPRREGTSGAESESQRRIEQAQRARFRRPRLARLVFRAVELAEDQREQAESRQRLAQEWDESIGIRVEPHPDVASIEAK